MSHLLSHHSIKRAEETTGSFHWNINLLKIVCNTTEQKKNPNFLYTCISPIISFWHCFLCLWCWKRMLLKIWRLWNVWVPQTGLSLQFHVQCLLWYSSPVPKIEQKYNDVQGHFRYCRFLILCVYLIPWLLHFV